MFVQIKQMENWVMRRQFCYQYLNRCEVKFQQIYRVFWSFLVNDIRLSGVRVTNSMIEVLNATYAQKNVRASFRASLNFRKVVFLVYFYFGSTCELYCRFYRSFTVGYEDFYAFFVVSEQGLFNSNICPLGYLVHVSLKAQHSYDTVVITYYNMVTLLLTLTQLTDPHDSEIKVYSHIWSENIQI